MATRQEGQATDVDLTVRALDTPSLGDRSYLVHDGTHAFVVDPQRDIDRVLALADQDGVTIRHVFETHIHNDYVTGGLALARETGAAYHVNADDDVAYDREPIRPGDAVALDDSGAVVTAMHTPGHTFTHLAYVLRREGDPVAVFTGGSLLYGATGRPDLLGPTHTGTLARLQYASARQLVDALPDSTGVFPTHGFGSFCSTAGQSEATESTIGQERKVNGALTSSEEEYVRELLAGLDAFPAYYAHMGPANAAGPAAPDLSRPRRADAAELSRRIAAGEWVVDLRDRVAFAAGHAPGTLNFGLDGQFSTYLGWLIDWGTPVTLLGATDDQVAQAQREMVRIGIERPAAAATGRPAAWSTRPPASFPVATYVDLARAVRDRDVVVLDVRRRQEYRERAIDGATNIPIHDLPHRLDDVPPGEVWVHCGGGYRASVAASFLAAAGRQPVTVDDDFDKAAGAGLRMTRPDDHERETHPEKES